MSERCPNFATTTISKSDRSYGHVKFGAVVVVHGTCKTAWSENGNLHVSDVEQDTEIVVLMIVGLKG